MHNSNKVHANIPGNISGDTTVTKGYAHMTGNVSVNTTVVIKGHANMTGNANVTGNVVVSTVVTRAMPI